MYSSSRTQPIIFIAAIIFLTMIIVILIFFLAASKCSNINDRKENVNISNNRSIQIITRDEWLAKPPRIKQVDLEIPSERVIIAHTANEECYSRASCIFEINFIQAVHVISKNFDDITYNFLVGGDGAVYEGRGWDKQGAHTKGYNADSICIAFIGTFILTEPPEKQLRAAKLIIEESVRLGKLKPDYKLYGQRQLIATESPGEALYKIIQKWPHWTNQLK